MRILPGPARPDGQISIPSHTNGGRPETLIRIGRRREKPSSGTGHRTPAGGTHGQTRKRPVRSCCAEASFDSSSEALAICCEPATVSSST